MNNSLPSIRAKARMNVAIQPMEELRYKAGRSLEQGVSIEAGKDSRSPDIQMVSPAGRTVLLLT